MNTYINEIAKEFNIPTIDRTKKIWFIRTNGGSFYQDYCVNGFVALGWDKISTDLITSQDLSWEQKKNRIIELYPDEQRPGLILGQLISFYQRMSYGDIVLIPAMGGRQISIGILGELVNSISHKPLTQDYVTCDYLHKRSVYWIKEIDLCQDIYLFRELRAQQTISEISDCANLVYRNLFSAYITDNEIHLTIQKISNADLSMIDNINLYSSIMSIFQNTANLYNCDIPKDSITIKTAVGSPGFIELISNLNISAIAAIAWIRTLIGKVKNDDSKTTATGLLAIANTINSLINDHSTRKNADKITNVEIEERKANVEKTKAETEKIKAETERINIENQILQRQLTPPTEEMINKTVELIGNNFEKLSTAAESAGLICDDSQSTNIAS